MKHLTMSLFCAGLVALAACNKEKAIEPVQQPATETKATPGSVKKEKTPPKWYNAQYNPKTGNCWWWYGNCIVIETIIVTPNYARAIYAAADSGSPKAVAETLAQEELSDLVMYCLLENGYAEKLLSGNYYISRTSDDGKVACYIAGTQYPVTNENMEFAFQFAYGAIEE